MLSFLNPSSWQKFNVKMKIANVLIQRQILYRTFLSLFNTEFEHSDWLLEPFQLMRELKTSVA